MSDTARKDKVLFIDARHLFRQVDRAHRDFLPEQIEFLANVVRIWRGDQPELRNGSGDLLKKHGLDKGYVNVSGLCRVVPLTEINNHASSLSPGRYVGASARDSSEENFQDELELLQEEFERLTGEARLLEDRITANAGDLLAVSV